MAEETRNTAVQAFTGSIAGVPQLVTNARDLHAFLDVGRDFSNWIKDRVEQYGFTEGEDFSPVLAKSTGGRPGIDYHLSLDMAKELAMIENSDQGRAARRYFIDLEKIAAQHQPLKRGPKSGMDLSSEEKAVLRAACIREYQSAKPSNNFAALLGMLAGEDAAIDLEPTPAPSPLDSGLRRNDGERLDRLDAHMAQLASSMATLAAGIGASLAQMNTTRKYISLLELNQQGKRKMTPEVREEITRLAAEGMNNADIGRLLRVSRTSVSLFLAGKYKALPDPASAPPRTPGRPVEDIVAGFVEREQARLTNASEVSHERAS